MKLLFYSKDLLKGYSPLSCSVFLKTLNSSIKVLKHSFKTRLALKLCSKKSWMAFAFLPLFSEAASELSFWVLFTQLFNFSLFFVVLILLVRKPVKLLYHQRQKDFFSFEKQALALEKQKKEENKEWEQKILALNLKEKNIKQKAQEEGDRFHAEKQKELMDLKERLKKHSDFLIHLETEKLKKQQFDYWKQKLVELSKKELEHLGKENSFQKKEKHSFINFLKSQKKEVQL